MKEFGPTLNHKIIDSSIDYPVSKQLSTLLGHGDLPREDYRATEFWRLKDYLRNHYDKSQNWSDEKWKSTRAKSRGNKKRFQYCTDPSGQEILYLRALQGHSGRNLIDPSLQDNVLIPNDFFEYIYHIGCAVSLHSISNSGSIPGGKNLSKRQKVFFLPVNPMDKEQNILIQSTWKHRVFHGTSIKSGRNAGRTCLMFVVIPRCTMSAEHWSIHGDLCYGGLFRGSVVPAKFLA